MEWQVRLRGRGRVEVAAYGVADAEHRVEKEILTRWPEARVQVTDLARSGGGERIVEEFTVSYRVQGALRVAASTREQAPAAAFRHARGLLSGTRFQRTEWECLEVVKGA